jgi:positive regulator of sigma E activity
MKTQREVDEQYFRIWWILNQRKITVFKWAVLFLIEGLVLWFVHIMLNKHFGSGNTIVIFKVVSGLGITYLTVGKFVQARKQLNK